MKTAEIKLDLFQKIEQLSARQLKEVYGLLENYFNSKNDIEDWDIMSPEQRTKIKKGIEQSEAGMGEPANEVIKRLKRKHGIDG